MSEERTKCPYCLEEIVAGAKKCSHCGEILDPTLRELEQLKSRQNQAQSPIIVSNNNNNNNNNGNGNAAPNMVPKSRLVYILLALFLGALGIHNFYAGFGGRGAVQLLITLLLGWCGIGFIIVGIWVLIEIFVVNTDARGVRFC